MTKENNPIKVVEINAKDHRAPLRDVVVKPKIFDDGDSAERRKVLADEVRQLNEYFSKSFSKWPTVSAVAKVVLKEEALAKSHRPTSLFSARSCPIIGTLDFGEILVSVTPGGLKELEDRIVNNESIAQKSNISALEKIDPYTANEKIGGFSLAGLKEESRKGVPIKIKLFDHKEPKKNLEIIEALEVLMNEIGLSASPLNYGVDGKLFALKNIDCNLDKLETIADFIGVKSVLPMPSYGLNDFSVQMSPVTSAGLNECPAPDPNIDYPLVGVIDSGVCPKSTLLAPWVVARESFVPLGDEDYSHGTMVAGLIANPRALNHKDPRFPSSQAKIIDVNIFPKKGLVLEEDIASAIETVIPKYPDVKVWNLSLGGASPVNHSYFSDLALFLDELHDKYGCLFVIASGNQNDSKYWPTSKGFFDLNRISSPADSSKSLTVGSIAHKDTASTLVKCDETSPFSRIGPGPCFIPKPEVVHYGGNNAIGGGYAQTGVLSLGPGDMLYESVGTSFAAPIVSSQAGQLFHYLRDSKEVEGSPETIKALLIHSALIDSPLVSKSTINSCGFGKPGNVEDFLYCEDHCITMLLEVDVRHGGFEFERFPFPMADCLFSEGKFKGEVLMTLVYSPIVDRNYASEYCRTNVDVGFGSYVLDEDGSRKFASRVPAAPKDINKLYEKICIEHGFKWSPVKAYHKIFPRGVDIKDWRLRMKVTRRAEEHMPDKPQKASLVITIRSLDPSAQVYNETIRKMNLINWIVTDIDQHLKVSVSQRKG